MHESTNTAAPANDFSQNGGEEKINVLVAKKTNKNKKRVNLSSIPSASTNGIPSASTTQQKSSSHDFAPGQRSTSTRQTSFPSPDEQPFGDTSHTMSRGGDWDMDAGMDVPISALDGPAKGKSRDEGKVSGFVRNLGGNVHRGVGDVKTIASAPGGREWREPQGRDLGLDVPPLVTYTSCEVEGTTSDILEVWNYESGGEFAWLPVSHP
jgi:protein HIRA/HIR1